MGLDYDLTGYVGAGSQLSWPRSSLPRIATPVAAASVTLRQHSVSPRHTGHVLAAAHTNSHKGLGHTGHGASSPQAHAKKHLSPIVPSGEKAF